MSSSYSRYSAAKVVWWALGLALLLMLPSLWVGLQIDDYFHWGLVNQRSDVLLSHSPLSPFGLFSFLDGDTARVRQLMDLGLLPWWTNPLVEYAFWRPLTEITHWLDYALWPRHPMLMHLHNLFYFALMLWAGFRLFHSVQGENKAWVWAVFLFALSYSHGVPAGWLANRNSVLAVLFMALALASHHRWRSTIGAVASHRAAVLSCVWFGLSLLCGEVAVSGGAYIFAYAFFYERGPWLARIGSLLPCGMVGVLWLGLRGWLGYGASGSGHYLDPLQTPWLFVQALFQRGVDLLAGLVWVIPPELATALPDQRRWWVVGLCLLLLYLIMPLLKRERRARFWLVGSLLCLVPVASTIPHSRLLIAASLGFAGLLGLVFASWREGSLMPLDSMSGFRRKLTSVVLSILVALQLGLSALLLPVEAFSMRLAGDSLVNSGAKSWQLEQLAAPTTPVLINPPLSSAGGYINGVRDYLDLAVTPKTWLLVSGVRELTVQTVDDHTLEIKAPKGLYDPVQEGLLRGPQAPFQRGDKVSLSGLTVTVVAEEGGVPVHARFQFEQGLNSDAYAFSHWHGGEVAPCNLPNPGQSIKLKLNSDHCANVE